MGEIGRRCGVVRGASASGRPGSSDPGPSGSDRLGAHAAPHAWPPFRSGHNAGADPYRAASYRPAMPISSTSNSNVAPGGITLPAPLSP